MQLWSCGLANQIRFNLDPQEQKSDHELWSVLERVHLDGKIRALEGGLAGAVAEGGDSFSIGQRQLICMARAMLRGSQVLLMDEATSSVDIDTDRRIQELVREEFKSRTILTIAHRLNTIIDYDKICVVRPLLQTSSHHLGPPCADMRSWLKCCMDCMCHADRCWSCRRNGHTAASSSKSELEVHCASKGDWGRLGREAACDCEGVVSKMPSTHPGIEHHFG